MPSLRRGCCGRRSAGNEDRRQRTGERPDRDRHADLKYSDHLPLYRQSAILEREAGIGISRVTMDGWVMRAGELLLPLVAAVKRDLLAGAYLQADETPVSVQSHGGTGANHQAYLWQYGRPGASAVFDFQMGRGREGPKLFLGRFEGILQTDGYAGYDRVGGPEMIHAACWSHADESFMRRPSSSLRCSGYPHRSGHQ